MAFTVCTSEHKPVFATFDLALSQHDFGLVRSVAGSSSDAADVVAALPSRTGFTLGRARNSANVGAGGSASPDLSGRARIIFQLGSIEASFVRQRLLYSNIQYICTSTVQCA